MIKETVEMEIASYLFKIQLVAEARNDFWAV